MKQEETTSMKRGNYRFKLSDMIPNAWFYKLKDMSKSRKQYTSQPLKKKPSSANTTSRKSNVSQKRYSYYYASEPGIADKCCNPAMHMEASNALFPDPQRKSSVKRSKRKTIYRPSPKLVSSSFSADCSFHASLDSAWTEFNPVYFTGNSSSSLESSPEPHFHELLLSESEEDDDVAVHGSFDQQAASLSSFSNCKVSSSTTDIVIDVNDESHPRKIEKIDGFGMVPEPRLTHISTKPENFNQKITEVSKFKRSSSKLEETEARGSLPVKIVKKASIQNHEEKNTNHARRRFFASSKGIRLRSNSPKISRRKIRARKSLSLSRNKTLYESFAVVKSSVDPQKDFEESMMEMIMEKNIRSSKDLEELLACYLSLNSNEYHDVIVKAFEKIWFDMAHLRL